MVVVEATVSPILPAEVRPTDVLSFNMAFGSGPTCVRKGFSLLCPPNIFWVSLPVKWLQLEMKLWLGKDLCK